MITDSYTIGKCIPEAREVYLQKPGYSNQDRGGLQLRKAECALHSARRGRNAEVFLKSAEAYET